MITKAERKQLMDDFMSLFIPFLQDMPIWFKRYDSLVQEMSQKKDKERRGKAYTQTCMMFLMFYQILVPQKQQEFLPLLPEWLHPVISMTIKSNPDLKDELDAFLDNAEIQRKALEKENKKMEDINEQNKQSKKQN